MWWLSWLLLHLILVQVTERGESRQAEIWPSTTACDVTLFSTLYTSHITLYTSLFICSKLSILYTLHFYTVHSIRYTVIHMQIFLLRSIPTWIQGRILAPSFIILIIWRLETGEWLPLKFNWKKGRIRAENLSIISVLLLKVLTSGLLNISICIVLPPSVVNVRLHMVTCSVVSTECHNSQGLGTMLTGLQWMLTSLHHISLR